MIQRQFVRTLTICALVGAVLPQASFGQNGPGQGSQTTANSPTFTPPPTPGQPAMSLSPSEAQFRQSVPEGTASSTAVALTLNDAIARGLHANLGLLTSEQSSVQSRAQRMKSLSALLPKVTGSIQETAQQTNLAALGFSKFGGFPGAHIPLIVGPFSYSTAEAEAQIPLFNWSNIQSFRASRLREKAAALSLKDARDLVVLAVGNAYLEIIASAARVDAIQAQVNTARVLFNRASDKKKAGVSPGIDVLRAQVELQQQQQALVVQKNQLEKDKLTLARAIGLPNGQEFTVADPTQPIPLEAMNLNDALTKAYANRSDYQAAEMQVKAAERTVQAAKAQWYPTLGVSGYYGDQGPTFSNSHGVFSVTGSLNFNIFDGRRIKSDVLEQQSQLTNLRNQLQNLKGQIDFDVRNALLDLKASNEQVTVAKSNSQLAHETLTQAQDRFSAGVADNLEVVQAQEAQATASENLINALYSNNVAKVELARALGVAEQGIRSYFAKNPEKH